MNALYTDKIETALKSFMTDHPGVQTRDQAITTILESWFTSHGYLPPQQEGRRPEDLDASNDD
ncbi:MULTISPECIES: hypothetical protein [unclassified Ensifer]|uniref:hypothetical protein n=1 Tax=unclassified Ensifer TaxID=2633371 RepID=UPI0008131850|nr:MULTISPECIES: hypothetical protein [unclassified Ensifer]OCP04976.1 hypothetical protein BC362_14540 [Ensifer sp. LC14]OCP11865.1 hypothetical protein BC374_16465 [Ensifer sp. LC13]OCP12422.1 hypothetical protein BBX50_16665 [Ensifer sp. LC11]OCP33611.1 hypothetical protein BC364_15180 [Ensifer sp. LC499]